MTFISDKTQESGTSAMVYISSDGRVLQAKPWGLHSITDFFWGIIAFLQLFFRSLIDPNANSKGDNYSTQYRNTGGRGGPPGGGPRKRMGGFGGGQGAASAPPPAAGGG